jgi:hypothetical protein
MRTSDLPPAETAALPAPIGDALERSRIGLYDLCLGGVTAIAVLAAVSLGVAEPRQERGPVEMKTISQPVDCPLADLSCAHQPGAVFNGAGF